MRRYTPAIVIFLVIVTLPILTSIAVDFFWFQSFARTDVWLTKFVAKAAIFVALALISGVILSLNAAIAFHWVRTNQSVRPIAKGLPSLIWEGIEKLMSPEVMTAVRRWNARAHRVVVYSTAVGIAILIGMVASGHWLTLLQAQASVPFGVLDPVFHLDTGFYTFSLPLLVLLRDLMVLGVITAFISATWVYVLVGGPSALGSLTERSGMRRHLCFLLGAFVAILAFSSGLAWFSPLFASRDVIWGAAYSDMAALPLMKGATVVLVIAALAWWVTGWVQKVRYPIILTGLGIGIWILARTVVPILTQQLIVKPNEFTKERPFILQHIALTRTAFGIQNVEIIPFSPSGNFTSEMRTTHADLLSNIRLWDEEPIHRTFKQLQEIRSYYEFGNVDVDRYPVDGRLQQVMLSAREINVDALNVQAKTWVNEHLVYTHGYGLCMSPVNAVTPEGLPTFYVKDIPPTSTLDRSVSQPGIYFGESQDKYAIVNTKQAEFDSPSGDINVYTHYKGQGGVRLHNIFRRLLFASAFSDAKIAISPLITKDSRILYGRNIQDVANRIAPFLKWDKDPYLVLTQNGRMVWILDAYTVLEKMPYVAPVSVDDASISYIRNAAKLTIDAYSGETHLYAMDEKDPVLKSFSKIYPKLFESASKIPMAIRSHVRYPRDLFLIQSAVLRTYQMTDPNVFYNREDTWSFPLEKVDTKMVTMRPYYIVTQVPGDTDQSFIQMIPFTPAGRQNMIAWLSVRCDWENYGRLRLILFPKRSLIFGPNQVESRIDQDTEISSSISLWSQAGSSVNRGNLMVIPIANTLLYIEPIYLQSTQSQMPELKRVVVSEGDRVVMSETLDGALSKLLDTTPAPATPSAVTLSVPLLDKIKAEYAEFKAACRNVRFDQAGEHLQRLDTLMNSLIHPAKK